ncbi:MAG: acyl carrier protein [Sneathiella sp.]
MSDVAERVKQIVAKHFDLKETDVVEGTKINEDLEADSLDRVELMMAFEEEFEIEILEEPADFVETIGDLVKLIEENLKK